MITADQINELRPLVEAEPEGSPARILLAAWDEMFAKDREDLRNNAITMLKSYGHEDDEIAILLARHDAKLPLPAMERVKCLACEGWGWESDTESDCRRCHGDTKMYKFIVPGIEEARRAAILEMVQETSYSMRELEKNPPKGMSEKTARVTMQAMLDQGLLRLDDDLRLALP
jgi:hypothetical protein